MAERRKLASPPATLKSPVWRQFGFPYETVDGKEAVNRHVAVCRLCDYMTKYTGATTNMNTHLKRHHPDVILPETGSSAKRKTDDASGLTRKSQQLKISDVLSKPLRFNSDRAAATTKSIGKFIAVDMRPYSIVENVGFQAMVNTLEPKYKIPSRPHFSEKLIPQLYEETKLDVLNELANTSYVAITTDGWTSRAVESYITITAHYLNKNWMLCSRVLQTRIIHESPTAVNVGAVLSGAIVEWGLTRLNGQVPVVTDNASNMDGAVKAAGLGPNIKCFAHTVNLATQRGLGVASMKTLLSRVKRIVAFFHRSSVANSLLKTKQDLLKLPHHKLIIDVATCWNSSYDMMVRYLEQQPAITATLMSGDVRKNIKDLDTLREEDITNLEDAVSILKDMKDITTVLCDEKQPTVSLIYPMKYKILKSMELVGTESSLIRQLKVAIKQDMMSRYKDPEIEQFLVISSAVDPRFKSLPQLDDIHRQELHDVIIQKVLTQGHVQQHIKTEPVDDDPEPGPSLETQPQLPTLDQLPPTPETTSTSQSSSSKESGQSGTGSTIKNLLGDVFITGTEPANKTPLDIANAEVRGYFSEPTPPLDCNPLKWWCENGYRYPMLSNIVQYYLTVPGTSVPSERVLHSWRHSDQSTQLPCS
ncbi:zinc finger BED domain-containing protein 1-like [Pecten maximus]|uniref:zinc finger BED domain-containing protein 1-like n=1 Tax=Pecten maximus TaxID=6579 RepID=UPI0014586F1C|nr:zinc finger BED domain-containing protein 1-like [Pecten maximus]